MTVGSFLLAFSHPVEVPRMHLSAGFRQDDCQLC